MSNMTKEDVRFYALEDALNEVRKEYDKALDDVLNDKGKGVFGTSMQRESMNYAESWKHWKGSIRPLKACVAHIPTMRLKNSPTVSYMAIYPNGKS